MPNDLPSADRPSDADTTAARATSVMAYAVAIVGALGATIALRAGDIVAALLVLTTTLGVAALLAGIGTLLRGLRDIESRLRAIERRPLERPRPSTDPDSASR